MELDKDIQHIIVATTEGSVGELFSAELSKYRVIVVTHHTGFRDPNTNELDEDRRQAGEKEKRKEVVVFRGGGRKTRDRRY